MDGRLPQRLRELGWTEGRSIAIVPVGPGANERGAEIVAEFARRKVDVIVTTGSSALAVKEAISTVPVVFAMWQTRSGAATSPAGASGRQRHRPVAPVARHRRKRLELLREVVPGLRRATSSAVSTVLATWSRRARSRRRPARRDFRLRPQMPNEPSTSRLPSSCSRGAPMPFRSSATRSSWPTAFASTCWPSVHACRRCTAIARGSRSAA